MTFTAKYGGTCAACEQRIKPGDEAQYDAYDDLVHAQCPPDPTVQQRPACPSCFMELPVSGTCGTCDD